MKKKIILLLISVLLLSGCDLIKLLFPKEFNMTSYEKEQSYLDSNYVDNSIIPNDLTFKSDVEGFGYYDNHERRADFIFKETFKTGYILIYKNKNDMTYKADKDNKLISNRITYEKGEYAFIYIESKGFVGINIGDDKVKNSQDDRNEFNVDYYKSHYLPVREIIELRKAKNE